MQWQVFVTVSCLFLSLARPVLGMSLAKNGAAQAVIVVKPGSMEPEQHAAAELAQFLGQVTGAKFEIVAEAPRGRARLLVGPEAAKLADSAFTIEGLGNEGIVIRTVGNDLILAGGRPRGTLYAVYTFLEDHVGCRWWTSKASTIPSKPTLEIGSLSIRYVPPLEYRESHWFDAFDPDWAVRNKNNGNTCRLDGKRGGKVAYITGFVRTVHTFYPLIPPPKYFKDHPEWFSEIGGVRTHERAQLCLTNEPMRRELTRNLRERLLAEPAAAIAWIGQNDNLGNCQCAPCRAADDEEGSPAGAIVRFVNSVAADLEKEFPHVLFGTAAYQYSRKPPQKARTRHNVIVLLSDFEASFGKPLADERNREFQEHIAGWSRACRRLYIYDYAGACMAGHYFLPHPNLRVLGPNIQFFVRHGAMGITEQGPVQTPGTEFAHLRAWVIAKLLWNPALDAQKLIDEFLDGYYGAARSYLRSYLKLTHDAVEASGDWLGCRSPDTAKFLTFELLSNGLAQLRRAEAAVQHDPELSFRVQLAQLPVKYAFIRRWDEMRERGAALSAEWPMPATIREAFDEFMKVAERAGITHLRGYPKGFALLEEALKRAQR